MKLTEVAAANATSCGGLSMTATLHLLLLLLPLTSLLLLVLLPSLLLLLS